jgi:hypothetical protein
MVASFVTGRAGRFVAFWLDLGSALVQGIRRRRG